MSDIENQMKMMLEQIGEPGLLSKIAIEYANK